MSVWEGVAITVLAVGSIQPVLGTYNGKKVVIDNSFHDLKQNKKN